MISWWSKARSIFGSRYISRISKYSVLSVATLLAAASYAINAAVNAAPVLTVGSSYSGLEGRELSFQATASDDGLPAGLLTFSLVNAPEGAAINPATGQFRWTPAELVTNYPKNYTFKVRVSDGELYSEKAVTIAVNKENVAPVLEAIGDKTVNEHTPLTLTLFASDTDLPYQSLILSVQDAPEGSSFINGRFTWTPTEAQGPGSYIITFEVGDGRVITKESITVTVNEVNVAPVLAAIGNKTVNENTLLTFTATAADADLPANTLAFSLEGAPAGASINPTSGQFNWTPTEAQGPAVYTFTIIVSDGELMDSEQITVTVTGVNDAPVITEITVPAPIRPDVEGVLLVNSHTTSPKTLSDIAIMIDGGFVVSWMSDGQDNDGYGVYAQRYDVAANKLGSEFRVNTYTTGHQEYSQIAALADGGFVVVWVSYGHDDRVGGVYAKRYNAQGQESEPPLGLKEQGGAVGNEFLVNSYTALFQNDVQVTALADGGFVVTWTSYYQDNEDGESGIYAKRYNAEGEEVEPPSDLKDQGHAVGNEFLVNTYTTYQQYTPKITSLADGGFIISWVSRLQAGFNSAGDIYAKRYNAQGEEVEPPAGLKNENGALGNEFLSTTYFEDEQNLSSITALADGGFIVSWYSQGQNDDAVISYYAKRYNSLGQELEPPAQLKNVGGALGNEFQVDGRFITALTDGGFIIMCTRTIDNKSIAFAKRYSSFGEEMEPPAGLKNQGGAQGNEFLLAFQERLAALHITATADGGFIVGGGCSRGESRYVCAQRFNATGEPVTSDITLGYHGQLAATDANGDAITWTIAAVGDAANYGTASIDANGQWRFDIDYSSAAFIALADGEAKTITLTATANDGQGAANSAASYSVTFTIHGLNDAPVISGNPATQVDRGAAYRFAPMVSDIDGDSLSFSAQGLPAWLSVNAATGEVSGTAPVAALNEDYTIELTVSDGAESASISWNLAVVLQIGDITGLWLKDGELANERFGGSLALFDATGDGLAEVYVGSPTRTVELAGKKLKNAGGVDILASSNGALLHRVNATVAKQRFGFAIAVVADQNSDGIEDLVVGKPFAGKGGEIALHSGADGSVIRTLIKGEGKSASSITSIMPLCAIDPQHLVCRMLGSSEQGGRIGYSLAVADVDGNGGADLIVGLPQANVKTPVKLNKAGSVIVYQGLSDNPRYVINGQQAGEALGASVAADDNYLLVGSPNFDVQAAKKLKDAGRVQLFNLQDGSTAGSTDGTAAKQLLGSAVASFNQDVNGDSEPDWAAAAAGDKSGKPVKLFTGMTQPAQFAEITASAPKKADAIRLAAGLDINGDGVSDLVIGLPSTKVTVPLNNKSKTLKNAGQVQVISGANWVP